MIDQDVNELQLEDVEDYTADYPPEGFPKAEENIHTTSDVDVSKKYRRSVFSSSLRNNKWAAGLAFIIAVLLIAIIAIAAGGAKEDKYAAGSGAGASAGGATHQAPIVIDPKTLDPSVTKALMTTLKALYSRHSLESAPLEQEDSPQRKAFYWLATDENLDKLDHTQKSQRFALATFYYATNAVPTAYTENPMPWETAHLWMSTAHVCEWKGIVCNTQQHVEAIDLERNNLCGFIPPEITILADHLIELDLTSNLIHMEGDMFDAFKTLEKLEVLLLDDNYIASKRGLPSQFRHLTNLEKLRLSYNLLEGELEKDHKVLSNLSKLTHLEIESNFLTGTLPDVIGEMKDLVYLYMRRNEMKYNLDFLKAGKLTNLFALWLDSNQITGTIPTEIGYLTELASLSMTNATLAGPIPTEIGKLAGLRRLWLYSNELTGQIPAELDNLDKLEVLEVHHNNLGGAMPQGICSTIQSSGYEYKSLTSDCKAEVSCATSCCTDCF